MTTFHPKARAILGMVGLLLVVLVALPATAQEPPRPDGVLIFEATDGPGPTFYVATLDLASQEVIILDQTPNYIGVPAWSPDGEQIVHTRSTPNGGAHIFIMDAEGRGLLQVTTGEGAYNDFASWSPDGTRLAFSRGDRNREVLIILDMTSGDEQLVTLPRDLISSAFAPTWSPDGTRLAFSGGDLQRNVFDIYVVDLTTDEVVRLSELNTFADGAVWSPDGERVAFYAYEDDISNLYLVNADGSGPLKRLTNADQDDSTPTWSPDGRYLAYARGDWETSQFGLALMEVASGQIIPLETGFSFNLDPDWLPAP